MDVNIYVNHTHAIDMNIESVIQRHANNGEIAVMFAEAWRLREAPVISNLNVKRIESKKRRRGTVVLSKLDIIQKKRSRELEGNHAQYMADSIKQLAMVPIDSVSPQSTPEPPISISPMHIATPSTPISQIATKCSLSTASTATNGEGPEGAEGFTTGFTPALPAGSVSDLGDPYDDRRVTDSSKMDGTAY